LAAKTHVITNFINKDVFVPATNKQAADVCRVVCVARIAEQKNVKLFLQAVKELKQRGEQFVIDWYGLPFRTYGDECNALIREYDIADVFRFHAPTNEIIKVYQSSDLFCLPSIYEGFPNVVCEAMCCGLPVVCSDVNDNGYIVADGTNGFLFNPKDVESMASTLQRFFHLSAEQKEEMARKSREISLAKFSADTFIQQYIKLIEQ
jgi:glycosyltransferase involved in cell wall biosynthesis